MEEKVISIPGNGENGIERQKCSLGTAEIMEILPHRQPFLMIDRIEDCEPGKWAVGRKCVTIGEPFFEGHFPGHPVMPGVLLLEAMAQTGAAALLMLPENRGKIALFAGIRKAHFRKQVVPGDVLEIRSEITETRGSIGIGKTLASVDGKTVSSAEIMFALTSSDP